VFGELGFYDASIVKITEAAGVAQGTFYLYFASKQEIFEELVRDLNARVRRAMQAEAAKGRDRIEAERLGFRGYFRFTAEHPALYRIIRQAEFVSPETLQYHYDRITEGYADGLRAAMDRGEVARGEPEVIAWALMAVGEMLGMRWLLWAGRDRDAAGGAGRAGRADRAGARALTRVGIAATAGYLPERWLSAAEIAAASGIPESVVVEKFGLRGKHVAAPDEHVSDMSVRAAFALLDEHGVDPTRSTASCTSGRPGRTTRSGRRRRGSPTGSARRGPSRSSTTTCRWARPWRCGWRSRCSSPSPTCGRC